MLKPLDALLLLSETNHLELLQHSFGDMDVIECDEIAKVLENIYVNELRQIHSSPIRPDKAPRMAAFAVFLAGALTALTVRDANEAAKQKEDV